MAKGSSSLKSGGGKHGSGSAGRPTPIPPNNGLRPAGWPSTTGKPSGNNRNNASQRSGN